MAACVPVRTAGRQTLENAIALVEANPLWGAHVVYGDTDSMFVHLPVSGGSGRAGGCSRSKEGPVSVHASKAACAKLIGSDMWLK